MAQNLSSQVVERAKRELTNGPLERTPRKHPLKGSLATKRVRGRVLPRWEYEITRSGRIRYLVDSESRVVYVEQARRGHPKDTE